MSAKIFWPSSLVTGSIIGVGDRKRGVHAVPLKYPNVYFYNRLCHPQINKLAQEPENLRDSLVWNLRRWEIVLRLYISAL